MFQLHDILKRATLASSPPAVSPKSIGYTGSPLVVRRAWPVADPTPEWNTLNGAGAGNRTPDLIITSDALYRLSYSSVNIKKWCQGAESNCGHADFQSAALPTELPRHTETNPTGLRTPMSNRYKRFPRGAASQRKNPGKTRTLSSKPRAMVHKTTGLYQRQFPGSTLFFTTSRSSSLSIAKRSTKGIHRRGIRHRRVTTHKTSQYPEPYSRERGLSYPAPLRQCWNRGSRMP